MFVNSSPLCLFSESIEHPTYLTQVPVSRARRYRRSTRSEATTASEESGGESASSVSQPVRSSARGKNLKGRKRWAFQAFRSPFLEENSFNTTLPSLKNSLFSNLQQEAKVKVRFSSCVNVSSLVLCLVSWLFFNCFVCFFNRPTLSEASSNPSGCGTELTKNDMSERLVYRLFSWTQRSHCRHYLSVYF